jgi:GNAT superfamily N-acetyltransferase
VTVRDAVAQDNGALMALAELCPMNGDLALRIDRRPDFFALNRLAGDRWRVGVVDGDNGPIGCIGVAARPAFVGGRSGRLAYVGDLKVHPAQRGRGIGRALAAWALSAAQEMVGEGDPMMATVLAGNTAVDRLQETFVPGARRRATIRSHSISLLFKRGLPRTALNVAPATTADLPAMAQLWQRLAVSRAFAPILNSFPLASPGLDYLVAQRPDGELAGFLGLWDQHHIKQMRVVGYSPRLAAARVAFNLAAPLFAAPAMPPPGGKLSYRTVVHPCAIDPEVLRTLLLHAYARLRGRYSFLTIALDTRDPLTGALSGLLAQPTDVDLLVLGGPADDRPAHFEIATV